MSKRSVPEGRVTADLLQGKFVQTEVPCSTREELAVGFKCIVMKLAMVLTTRPSSGSRNKVDFV